MSFLSLSVALVLTGQTGSWSERGVFAFGDLILDFRRNMERRGPFVAPLADCSERGLLCARGGIVRIVLPKTCGIKVGQVWTAGDIQTRVLFKTNYTPGPHNVNEETYYLASNGVKNVLYEYKPSVGVFGIYHDPLDSVDFIAMANVSTLNNIRREKPHYYLPLNTFDGFGACGRTHGE